MIRSVAFLVTMALMVAAAVGCGSSDDSSTNSGGEGGVETVTTSSLTKAQFIKKADEVCARQSEDFLTAISIYLGKHASDPGKSQDEITAEGVREVLLPKFQIQIDEVRNLGAPAGDEKEVEAILTAMQHAVDSLDKRNEVKLATDIDREFQHAGELALDYGIQECAN